MIIKPKVRGFICTNAHPLGCAHNVQEQIDYVKQQALIEGGPKNVLVIGASTGYGLASRINAAFGSGAATLGVFFEKPSTVKRTGSAGFYNSAAFEQKARAAGLYSRSVNGDAFSKGIKEKVIDIIKEDLGMVDLVVYSLASPRRTDPNTGETYTSTLKPINEGFTAKSLNTDTLKITEMTVEPASEAEIADTVKVMGGEDWELWMQALQDAGVLGENCKTTAFTYLGDRLTWPVYGHATIGKAKEDLDRASAAIQQSLAANSGQSNVAVLKALVTQASSAIPIMPLYISILYKVMKEEGIHEGCIEQIYRLFTEGLYSESPRLDEHNRFRMDERELRRDVQEKVEAIWPEVTEQNLMQITDYQGYNDEFLKLFGFGLASVDYGQEISPEVDAEFSVAAQ